MRSTHIIHLVESNKRHEWIEKLIAHLDRKGFSQTLVSLERDGDLHSFLVANYPQITMSRVHRKNFNTFTGVIAIMKVRKKNTVNLIFALGHPAALIAAIASSVLNVKFIFSHMQQPNFFKLMAPRWRGILHTLIYNLYITRADLIHSLSSEVTEFLVSKGFAEKKIYRVNIGLNFAKVKAQLESKNFQVDIPKGYPKILMVGRLAPEKNYRLAFTAFAALQEKNPNALLLVAGVGPQKNELEILAMDLNISQNVVFLGFLTNIPKVMTKVDLLLHLATTESYGQIYMEAMLSQLPVVCSRSGIAIDLNKDHVSNVLVINELSVQEINNRINYCLENIEVLRRENLDPFHTFRDHDEKFVFERISDSFTKVNGTARGK
jgi:glycosyltransferase involved in cell wall biosynthesis